MESIKHALMVRPIIDTVRHHGASPLGPRCRRSWPASKSNKWYSPKKPHTKLFIHLGLGSARLGSTQPMTPLHFTISSPLRNRISNENMSTQTSIRPPFIHFIAELPHFWIPRTVRSRAID